MLTLYHAPNTRALRPRWLLEELGVAYQVVAIDMASDEHRGPEYRAIHPLGTLPALVDGERVFLESAAMCLELADRYPDKNLAPAIDRPERGLYYQWMLYAVATLEPRAEAIIWQKRMHGGDMSHPAVVAAQADFAEATGPVASAISRGGYVTGHEFSAADVVMGTLLRWVHVHRDRLSAISDPLVAYVERLTERPAFQRAAG